MLENNRQLNITWFNSRKDVKGQRAGVWLDDLVKMAQNPVRGQETMSQYLALPKPQQDAKKDVGAFVGGVFRDDRRKSANLERVSLLAFDIDNAPDNLPERLYALGCCFILYPTRRSTPWERHWRIIVPLDKDTEPEKLQPLSLAFGRYIDPTLAIFDPVSFRAGQLMYKPSCCADSDYQIHFADKPMLSVDGLLATYADWRDQTSWPTVPGAVAPARLAAKQGDPEAKKGVVGAFCRVYSIEAAMAKFLPGVYEPVDAMPGRYTFTGGSTTGGAVLYDNGKFLYSYHATDPCSGRLVNAFDLVRLHRFEELDDEAAPGTPANRLPSYMAMCEMATQDTAVTGLLSDERWEKAQESFGPVSPAEEDDGAWRRPPMMDVDTQGKPIKSMKNLKTALEHDPKMKGKLRLNLFSGRIDITGELPWYRPGTTKTWGDDDAAQLRIYLEPFFGKMAKADILDAVAACASDQAYHPVQDYLNGLSWDGVHRLDTLFIDYLGAEDNAYTRAVTRKAFTAAVARVMRPGCKYDTMLVLIGGQGRHKSTILSKMGGEWFSDSLRTFGDKDSMETIQGTWVNEVAEMQALGNANINAVKMFLTKTNDYYRAAYGRYTADRPRQCVFFGTTNSKECLIDPTGGRRWWPVDIDRIPRTKNVFRDLDVERDQLWAEAVMFWKQDEPLHLPPDLEATAKTVQEEHRARHPWEGLILDYLDKEVPADWMKWDVQQRQIYRGGGMKYDGETAPRCRICAVEVWCEVLGKPRGDMRQRDTREINELLERMPGWAAVGVREAGKPYGKQRCFDRKTATDTMATDENGQQIASNRCNS